MSSPSSCAGLPFCPSMAFSAWHDLTPLSVSVFCDVATLELPGQVHFDGHFSPMGKPVVFSPWTKIFAKLYPGPFYISSGKPVFAM